MQQMGSLGLSPGRSWLLRERETRLRANLPSKPSVSSSCPLPTLTLRADRFTVDKPISTPIVLSPGESLYLYLTFKAGDKPAVPHQAFLYMQQVDTGLETFFPIDVTSSSAKGKLEIVNS